MKELLVEYVAGNLSGELEDFVKIQIDKNPEYQQEYHQLLTVSKAYENMETEVPSERMKARFEGFLKEEIKGARSEKSGSRSFSWMRIAASIALLGAVLYVGWFLGSRQNGNEIGVEELAFNKDTIIELLGMSSASTRMQAVNNSLGVDQVDDDILNALFYTLNTDENTNVRLAALDALSKFIEEDKVRKGIIESLRTQDNPGVQIELINLLVEIRETQALEPLRNLLENEEVEEFVKEEAQLGIYKLS